MTEREVVIELFQRGMPCSRIDRELNLRGGKAKCYVLQWWREDKARHESAGWVRR